MEWTDDAIVLSAQPHGETSLVVHLLTREHGRHAGRVRGGRGARTAPTYQTGNLVLAQWRARLEEHLGMLVCEPLHGYAAALIDDPGRLAALAAAAATAEATVPEREPHPEVFESTLMLLAALEAGADWKVAYVRWELELLAGLGFGLDLSRCAATGAAADLAYVSPKSGRAVSRAGAGTYKDRLLRLPPFLAAPAGKAPPADVPPEEVADALALTGFFLQRHALHERKLPPARLRFSDRLRTKHAIGI
jgi:DNA repair protein RecO (recombination protein O)